MVSRTERGWGGHYCCAKYCLFRRNTLLEKNGVYIVVSTVGSMVQDGKIEKIGVGRYYETMAFYSEKDDSTYHDADVSRQISFDSDWAIDFIEGDNAANEMHENVVTEIIGKLESGEIK